MHLCTYILIGGGPDQNFRYFPVHAWFQSGMQIYDVARPFTDTELFTELCGRSGFTPHRLLLVQS